MIALRVFCLAATLAMFALPNRADAQAFRPVSTLAVVDANAKTVGGVVASFKKASDSQSTDAIAMEVDGHIFRVNVTRTTFELTQTAAVFFESSDCSGTPYLLPGNIASDSEDLIPVSVVQPPGQTVYIPDSSDTPSERTLSSFYSINTGACVQPLSNPGPSLRALTLINLAATFTPPFHVLDASTLAPSPTQTPTARPQATNTVVPLARCCGDCDDNGHVTVDELVTAVNYALDGCPAPSAAAAP